MWEFEAPASWTRRDLRMPGLVNEMAEYIGYWSLDLTFPSRGHRAPNVAHELFDQLIELHKGVWEFGSLNFPEVPAGPGFSSDLSTGYPQDIVIKEFGSLTRFCLDQGPRSFLHTARARDPRCLLQVPWFCNHETV